tara:strand:+ start:687 stop:1166 length:480 start_codon:yes stop_codon:yes gene_type:complete
MNEPTTCTRDEIIANRRKDLKEAGPSKALSYFLKTNEKEKREVAESDCEFLGGGGLGLNVTLHMAAQKDAEELFNQHNLPPLEDAILECHTVILAAAIGDSALRAYFRHLLVELFDWCDELDGMIDVLTEMHNSRVEMPVDQTPAYLESWWEDLAPVAS